MFCGLLCVRASGKATAETHLVQPAGNSMKLCFYLGNKKHKKKSCFFHVQEFFKMSFLTRFQFSFALQLQLRSTVACDAPSSVCFASPVEILCCELPVVRITFLVVT